MPTDVMAQAASARNFTETVTQKFQKVRALTPALVANLSDADATVQSMPDASPAKWHLAHTSWFFETFVLSEHVPGYKPFDARFAYLFNSYYEAKGARVDRTARGLLTRPSLDDVMDYRHHVDNGVVEWLDKFPAAAQELMVLGCQHEEQHQELLLTDLLHLFSQNPLAPAVWATPSGVCTDLSSSMTWVEGIHGAVSIGHDGDGFAFDCEGPKHTTWLSPHALANRLVTNREWLDFIDDGGYSDARLWLSDGWDWARRNSVEAPLYWRRGEEGTWSHQFGLNGIRQLEPGAPVQHVSFYEADAFARWADARLPTEAEWESAAKGLDSRGGNLLDRAGPVSPCHASAKSGLVQVFGDLWEWTGSAFLPYPGFRPAPGAVGEYNGKFMSGQYVLKGGSCATPRGHVRASYRNFFYPHQRWQFTGVRLAKDI